MATRTTTSASALPFVADRNSLTMDGGHSIDWSAVSDTFRDTPLIQQSVVVGAAGALANATTVPVDAITYAIPNGTTLRFGTKKFVTLTAAAVAGATSLTVEAIPTALVDNDAATHTVQAGAGKKMIPAGYPMAASSSGSGPMLPANDGTANCLLATNAHEDNGSDALSGYGVILGGVIYSNLLPVTLAGGAVTALQAAGTGFAFRTYSDSTAA